MVVVGCKTTTQSISLYAAEFFDHLLAAVMLDGAEFWCEHDVM